jgi:hypothetical protein
MCITKLSTSEVIRIENHLEQMESFAKKLKVSTDFDPRNVVAEELKDVKNSFKITFNGRASSDIIDSFYVKCDNKWADKFKDVDNSLKIKREMYLESKVVIIDENDDTDDGSVVSTPKKKPKREKKNAGSAEKPQFYKYRCCKADKACPYKFNYKKGEVCGYETVKMGATAKSDEYDRRFFCTECRNDVYRANHRS